MNCDCPKCHETKTVEEFTENKKKFVQCNSCRGNARLKASNNREKYRMYYKKHYNKDPSKHTKRAKIYAQENKESKKEYMKKYRSENKDHIKKSKEEYKIKHKDKINLEKRLRNLRDPNYKIVECLRSRLRYAVKAQNTKKKHHTLDLIGCSVDELREHLEKQFTDDMTWNNHGILGWHIDHIIPCASWDLAKQD